MLPYFWFVVLVDEKPKFKWIYSGTTLPLKAQIVTETLSIKFRSLKLKTVEECSAVAEQYIIQSGYYDKAIASWKEETP